MHLIEGFPTPDLWVTPVGRTCSLLHLHRCICFPEEVLRDSQTEWFVNPTQSDYSGARTVFIHIFLPSLMLGSGL